MTTTMELPLVFNCTACKSYVFSGGDGCSDCGNAYCADCAAAVLVDGLCEDCSGEELCYCCVEECFTIVDAFEDGWICNDCQNLYCEIHAQEQISHGLCRDCLEIFNDSDRSGDMYEQQDGDDYDWLNQDLNELFWDNDQEGDD